MRETVQAFCEWSEPGEESAVRPGPISSRSQARCPSTERLWCCCSEGSCRLEGDLGGWSSRWWGSSWAGVSADTRRARVCGSAALWWPPPRWTTPASGLQVETDDMLYLEDWTLKRNVVRQVRKYDKFSAVFYASTNIRGGILLNYVKHTFTVTGRRSLDIRINIGTHSCDYSSLLQVTPRSMS